jgi:hypothetical protein
VTESPYDDAAAVEHAMTWMQEAEPEATPVAPDQTSWPVDQGPQQRRQRDHSAGRWMQPRQQEVVTAPLVQAKP